VNASLRLGVLVPCRNESAVIGRKLRNLARLRWPDAEHLIIVVDDHSSDDTAACARELAPELFPASDTPPAGRPTLKVVTHDGRPGKAGAIAAGLDALAGRVDLVLLTDADVIFREDALLAVEQAFATEQRLGMASGSQEFVTSLHEDGSPRDAEGAPPTPAPGRYDRLTARVRALESRAGRLFSIHGQLLAWRADLGLSASPGIAADDLDLMCQVRSRGLAVRKLDGARFLEVKTPPGPERRSQEIRRARAYVQVMRVCRLSPDAPWIDRLQFAAYRSLPLAAPWIALALVVVFHWMTLAHLPHPLAFGTLAVFIAVALSPFGRRAIRLLAVIAIATRLESADSIDDSWEMERAEPSHR
jgi:glycosyltransferase involved in cell wall biosynthesis